MEVLTPFFYTLGVLSFSFILWKRLREDYPYEPVFSATLILLGIGLLAAGFLGAAGDLSFWVGTLLVSAAGFYTIKKLGFKFFEFVDAVVPAFFLLSFFVGLASAVKSLTNPVSLAQAAVPLFSLVTYNFFFARYRRFSWYPSGKVGFAGLSSLGVYFTARGAVVFYKVGVLSLDSTLLFDAAGSVLLFLLFVFILYLRSERAGAQKILKWRK